MTGMTKPTLDALLRFVQMRADQIHSDDKVVKAIDDAMQMLRDERRDAEEKIRKEAHAHHHMFVFQTLVDVGVCPRCAPEHAKKALRYRRAKERRNK